MVEANRPSPEMQTKKKKEIDRFAKCLGCENDFYNGKNNYGIMECWSLKKAKLVWRKEVSINQTPPWKQKAIRVLDCFHRKGYAYVNKDAEY